ncbi:MAG: nucleoside triphosphate pyrophosphatase [Steroidobacteraceae bacterium]
MFHRPLILASTSRYRRELLGRLGLPFLAEAPGVDEAAIPGEAPAARAARLAAAKAHAVARRHPGALVIGSDQVAALGDAILDKPGNAERCRAQLTNLAGRTASFFTACAVVGFDSRIEYAHTDTTRVVTRALAAAEIDRYVEREQPFDCAGGFKVEALGIALFERVESQDPTALVGLPLIWLADALRRAGLAVP